MTVNVTALVTPPDHVAALHAIADWADELHLAYAWAASSGGVAEHWNLLPLERVRRAVLGIHFAQTRWFNWVFG